MKILSLVQGSPEWHEYRNDPSRRNASEASIIMGAFDKVTRDELLAWKNDPSLRVTNEYLEKVIFPKAHEAEASARAIMEAKIGDDLFPVIGVGEVEEAMVLSASFDGRTLDGETIWEHKIWNASKVQYMKDTGRIPIVDYWQCVQQMMVSGAAQIMYMVSDGTEENMEYVIMYAAQIPLQDKARLRESWRQFDQDRLNWTRKDSTPVLVGAAPDTLPAIRIELTGAVTTSNLPEFRAHALRVIGAINRDLQTDADFANAEAAVDWCADVESRIDAAKNHALSQTSSIDELFRALDDIKNEARQVRLDLTKLVKAEKENRRRSICVAAQRKVAEAKVDFEANLEGVVLPFVDDGIAAAMKGKRTIESLENAANTAASHAITSYRLRATEVQESINILQGDEAAEYKSLFPDVRELALRPADAVQAIITARIATYKAEQEAKARAAEAEAFNGVQAQQQQAERDIKQAASVPAPVEVPQDVQEAVREPLNLREINRILDPLTIKGKTLDEAGCRVPESQPARYDYAKTAAYLRGIVANILEGL